MLTQMLGSIRIINVFSSYPADFQVLVNTWLTIMISVSIVCFITSEITRNYSQVDKLWSLLPIVYSWITVASFHSARLILMASLVTLWGLRLSYNFYRKRGYNLIPWKGEEDYRWKIMRDTPALKGRFRFGLFNLLFISFYQNLVILLFSSPLLLAAINTEKSLSALDISAAILMLLFIVTESIADNQLFRFHREKRKAINGEIQWNEFLKKGFITTGLWSYVRHPNFISEQLIWVSFYLFGVAASGKLLNLTISGPVLLILIFAGSTRLTERISSSKYPGYSTYCSQVSRFIPFRFNRKQ